MVVKAANTIIREKPKVSTETTPQITLKQPRWIDQFARKGLFARFEKISNGQLRISDSHGQITFGQPDNHGDLSVDINVIDPRFYSDLAFGGSVAAGESYMQGCWTCSDLTKLIQIMVRNRHVLDAVEGSLSKVKAPLMRLGHWLNRNTQTGS